MFPPCLGARRPIPQCPVQVTDPLLSCCTINTLRFIVCYSGRHNYDLCHIPLLLPRPCPCPLCQHHTSSTANTCATGKQAGRRETAECGKFKACLRKLSPQTMPSTNCRGSWLSVCLTVSLSVWLSLCLCLFFLLPVSRLSCPSFAIILWKQVPTFQNWAQVAEKRTVNTLKVQKQE